MSVSIRLTLEAARQGERHPRRYDESEIYKWAQKKHTKNRGGRRVFTDYYLSVSSPKWKA